MDGTNFSRSIKAEFQYPRLIHTQAADFVPSFLFQGIQSFCPPPPPADPLLGGPLTEWGNSSDPLWGQLVDLQGVLGYMNQDLILHLVQLC